jgi:transposase-like protein
MGIPERINRELKQRRHIICSSPKRVSCLQSIWAVAVRSHEDWIEALCYLNTDALR